MNALNAAIVALLRADTELQTLGAVQTDPALIAKGRTGVYKDAAPQATAASPVPRPFIIYGKQSGSWDTNHNGGTIREPRYYIKAVDEATSSVKVGEIDERIGVLLNATRIETVDRAFRAFRTADMPDYREVSDGVTYNHVGGLYRFVPA